MDMIDRLLEHDRWATAVLLDVSRGLTDAQLDQPFDIGHGTLRDTFDHMIFNIEFCGGLMAGQPVESNRSDRSVPGLIARFEQAYTTFSTAARRARDEGRLDDTYVDHFGLPTTLVGTILHVPIHNVEHRSEALHILQRLGVPDLPEVDHLFWEHAVRGDIPTP